MLKDGTMSSNTRPYEHTGSGAPPQYLRSSDKAILPRLYSVQSEDFVATLRRIIATGRGRWNTVDGPVLSEGEPASAQLAWRMLEDGRQMPSLDLPPGKQALRLYDPWYVEPAAGRVGPLDLGLPAHLVRAILAAPALSPDHAPRVRAAMGELLPRYQLPAPREVAPPRRIKKTVQPRLELFAADLPFDPNAPFSDWRSARWDPAHLHRVPLARMRFRYGDVVIAPSVTSPTVMHEGELLSIARDRRGESAAWQVMRDRGFGQLAALHYMAVSLPHKDALTPAAQDGGSSWVRFMTHEVPALRRDGWEIEIADDFPIRIIEADGPILAELREGDAIDWFDLDLGVMVDGARVDLVPALIRLIESGGVDTILASAEDADGSALLTMPDGRLLSVPLPQLRPILRPLLELFSSVGTEGGKLRLSRMDAAELADLEAANAAVVWSGGDAVRALGRQLRDATGIPVIDVPESFTATLRPYQARGVDWMGFLRAAELGGVLADDMGLGKTVQALAHLVVEQRAGRLDRPSLVICPTSLVPNWRAEAARFAPGLRVLVLHGPDRAALFPDIPRHDLVITTYPLLARDHETLAAQEWHVAMLDEAQTIKNPAATTSKLARSLRARQRLCLSGTPLENHLGELWSLFDFLMPGFLGQAKSFARRYRTPIEKAGDTTVQAALARRVAPFLLRRTKAEVAADLPPKTDIAETVEMEKPQRAVYEAIRLAMHAKVQAAVASQGLARSGIVILDALLKLRQVCCDPRLLKLETAKAARAGSAKFDRLLEMLPEMLEEGRGILLFSQFTSMLALIEAELDKRGIAFVKLTGDTGDRTEPVARFQSGACRLFLISLKAGGTGLNLTAADTVIHYDPWWNPAVENQATDRAHRIGQDKPVFVHRLITRNSIEEKMEVLKARKQALVTGILGSGAGSTLGITEADLEELLGG